MLVSGRGTNQPENVDAIGAGALDAEVVGVFSDRPDAAALARVPAPLRWSDTPVNHATRAGFDRALGDAVAAVRPDWVVCAGYLRILGDAFVERFRGRLLNIHPSLLPKYRGLHTHARVLEAGEVEHGASVHFVVPELDAGAVIASTRAHPPQPWPRACSPSSIRCWSPRCAWRLPVAWLNETVTPCWMVTLCLCRCS